MASGGLLSSNEASAASWGLLRVYLPEVVRRHSCGEDYADENGDGDDDADGGGDDGDKDDDPDPTFLLWSDFGGVFRPGFRGPLPRPLLCCPRAAGAKQKLFLPIYQETTDPVQTSRPIHPKPKALNP